MKGCARTCVLWLLGWAAASAAFFYYFRELAFLEPGIWWASVGGGFCVILAFSYLFGAIDKSRERSLLKAAEVGTQPTDGKWTAVSGPIRSLNPLRAPFSNEPVVTYAYKVSRTERSGKSSSEVTYYDGKALASSTIATRGGAVRLLSVPTLEVPSEKLDYRTAIDNARNYVNNTAFQTKDTPKGEKVGMDEEHADDDGVFRVDSKYYTERGVDVGDCQLDERHIKQGETICAFGVYSQERHGLVPHPNWAKQTRIMRGDSATVAAALQKKVLWYIVGIVFFSGAAYAILRAYEHFARIAAVS